MDKYDNAVEHLTAHPEDISDAWLYPTEHRAGCLFLFAKRTKEYVFMCGCLTQIRCGPNYVAETKELTDRIRNDTRIPLFSDSISVEDLPVFAEWQRTLDKELGCQNETLKT